MALTQEEAQARLRLFGRNELRRSAPVTALGVLWRQVKSPLMAILVGASLLAALAGEWTDAAVVLVIVAVSVAIGFWREWDASRAIEELQARICFSATVIRDGREEDVPAAEVVPGDEVVLSAGSLVPADARVVEAQDFFVSEAVLTGESFPVEKKPGPGTAARLLERTDFVFMGTSVRSGAARCVVEATGPRTVYGAVAGRLQLRPPETEFERGLRRFGGLLTYGMLVMVLVVFAINVVFQRPPVEALLFSVALAVGLAPELLPVILSINLSRSAEQMARAGVLVRRLNAIENLGSMDVLCTDKTGTLTEGVVAVEGAFDETFAPSARVLQDGIWNAQLHSGLHNALDDALCALREKAGPAPEKAGEVPWDFLRKRLSVGVREGDGVRLLTKGALEPLLDVCEGAPREALLAKAAAWAAEGFRALGVADRMLSEGEAFSRDAERGLTFRGFLLFSDRPKAGVDQVLFELRQAGVEVKVISGDTAEVVRHVASAVGLPEGGVLTGRQLDALSDEALWQQVEHTSLFAQVDPNQKERIILSLKKRGHVVGFLGDGINDAPALHSADASVSVDTAVDVAREAADFVLLSQDLEVLRRGIVYGRTTFANTLKYVLTTTSANLGNMISMAAASLFLPFLPLLATQILLNNFLSDVPAMALANDSVDKEWIDRPRRWDMKFIRRFMIEFGLLSSAFDFLTFALLLYVFRLGEQLFRTGWFVESLLTELAIALVVRTRLAAFRSRPAPGLVWSTAAVAALAIALPWVPYSGIFGFAPLPVGVMLSLAAVTALYVVAAEALKKVFYRGVP